jgi:PadR family transcriptional regulator, regulatory protein PadR
MRDLAKGDIPTLVLSVLAGGACHGYAIARNIEQRSDGLLRMREGALYPALRLLEQEGMIKSQWVVQPSGPARRIYELTTEGHVALNQRVQEWQSYVQMINRLIGGGPNAEPA